MKEESTAASRRVCIGGAGTGAVNRTGQGKAFGAINGLSPCWSQPRRAANSDSLEAMFRISKFWLSARALPRIRKAHKPVAVPQATLPPILAAGADYGGQAFLSVQDGRIMKLASVRLEKLRKDEADWGLILPRIPWHEIVTTG